MLEEISSASKEQASGIEQVSIAVADMDKITQQNAADAEESASSVEEMSALAKTMKSFVNNLVTLVGSQGTHQSMELEKAENTR